MITPGPMGPIEIHGGPWFVGAPVGILCMRTRHALLPGNVQHAGSFGLPVHYACIDVPEGCSLMRGDPELLPLIIDAGRSLVADGISAVVGACGSFAHYQKPVAAALPVPTFLSIMVQVPFLLAALPAQAKLCIITAWADALTPNVYAQCDIQQPERLVIRQMAGNPAFDSMLAQDGVLRPDLLAAEVCAVAVAALAEDPAISAFVLQCSDLPPFAGDVAAVTGLPVFDAAGLIRWLQAAYLPPTSNGVVRRHAWTSAP